MVPAEGLEPPNLKCVKLTLSQLSYTGVLFAKTKYRKLVFNKFLELNQKIKEVFLQIRQGANEISFILVELMSVELTTSCLQGRRSPS